MLAWQLVFSYALVYGAVLSLVLTILASAGAAIARDMFVDGYPPAIKHAYGPMSRRAAAVRPYVAALLVGTALIVPVLGLFAVQAQLGSVTFGTALVFAASVLLVFNIVDLLILDWLVF